MPAGRPSKYDPSVLPIVREYIDNYSEHGDVIPQIAALHKILDVSVSSIYRWEENEEQFREVLDELRQAQHKVLLNGGISGDFNATITKLVLTKHGYTDKTETELTGKGGGPVEWVIESVSADKSQDA